MTRPLHVLVAVALAGALVVPARAADEVAVLIGKDLRSLRAAAEGIEAMEGVRARTFRLFEGTTALDAAVEALRRFRFDAVVALGTDAHEFYRDGGYAHPYSATLVPGDAAGGAVVPFDPDPADWAAWVCRVLPRGARLTALASDPARRDLLAPLVQALERRGRSMKVRLVTSERSYPQALRRVLDGSDGYFLARDPGLISPTRRVAHLLQEAHRRRVPVFGFTSGLVAAGALMSLEVPYRNAGVAACLEALGRPGLEAPYLLTVNDARASYLGLELGPEASTGPKPRGGGAGLLAPRTAELDQR